jgi:hypothetical protein
MSRSFAGYALYARKIYAQMREKLNIYSLIEVVMEYMCKWTQHILRMYDTFLSKFVYLAEEKHVSKEEPGQNKSYEDGTILDCCCCS